MKNGFVSGLHPVCPRLWHRDTRALFTVFTQIWGSRSLASPLGISRLPCQPPRQSQHRALNPHLSQAVDQVDREPMPPHTMSLGLCTQAVLPSPPTVPGSGLRAQGAGHLKQKKQRHRDKQRGPATTALDRALEHRPRGWCSEHLRRGLWLQVCQECFLRVSHILSSGEADHGDQHGAITTAFINGDITDVGNLIKKPVRTQSSYSRETIFETIFLLLEIHC